jgi:hypothetical protein
MHPSGIAGITDVDTLAAAVVCRTLRGAPIEQEGCKTGQFKRAGSIYGVIFFLRMVLSLVPHPRPSIVLGGTKANRNFHGSDKPAVPRME